MLSHRQEPAPAGALAAGDARLRHGPGGTIELGTRLEVLERRLEAPPREPEALDIYLEDGSKAALMAQVKAVGREGERVWIELSGPARSWAPTVPRAIVTRRSSGDAGAAPGLTKLNPADRHAFVKLIEDEITALADHRALSAGLVVAPGIAPGVTTGEPRKGSSGDPGPPRPFRRTLQYQRDQAAAGVVRRRNSSRTLP